MTWFLYLVSCKDGSLYTGITTDLKRRVEEHNTDNIRGSKYLRGRRPVKLEYYETFANQSEARKREIVIKNWKPKYKVELIENFDPDL